MRVWNTPGSCVKERTTSSPNRCAICRRAARGALYSPRRSSEAWGTSKRRNSTFTTSPSTLAAAFTSACAPTAVHLEKSMVLAELPSLAGSARKLRGGAGDVDGRTLRVRGRAGGEREKEQSLHGLKLISNPSSRTSLASSAGG